MERKISCPKCGTDNISWRSHCIQCGEELHADANQMPDFEKRGVEYWGPFISALIGFVGFGLFLRVEIQEFHGSLSLLSMLALPIIGLVLSWKKPLIGGFILILSSITALVYLFAGVIPSNRSDPFLFIGTIFYIFFIIIPLLISGIFFIKNSRESN